MAPPFYFPENLTLQGLIRWLNRERQSAHATAVGLPPTAGTGGGATAGPGGTGGAGGSSGSGGANPTLVPDQRANAQRFLAKIHRNSQDVTLLLLSDSTGLPAYWTPTFWAGLALAYPTHTVKLHLWDPTVAGAYSAPTTLQTGSGSQILHLYSFSITGAVTSTPLTPHFYSTPGGTLQTAVTDLAPDHILISYGHNEGATPASGGVDNWYSQYLELVMTLVEVCPDAEICVLAQNPESGNSYQAERADTYAKIAAEFGLGYIDVHQVFLDNGGADALTVDGVHPNHLGSSLWAAEVLRGYKYLGTGEVDAGSFPWPSVGEELLVDGDFSNFLGAAPDSWVVFGGATVSKNVTNFESENGYAVKVQAVSNTPGGIQQTISSRKFAGSWVSFAARTRVEVGAPGNAGVIGLYDGVGTSTRSRVSTFSQGGYRWVVWQTLVASTSTSLTAILYADQANQNGAASFDRVSVRVGRCPMVGQKGGAVRAETVQPGTFPDGTYQFGSNAGTFNRILLNGAASTSRIVAWLTAGVSKWLFNMSGTETGVLNAGGNFVGQAFDDAGTLIDQWLTITRASGGLITLTRAVMARAFGISFVPDNGDAGVTLTWGTAFGVQRWATALTAPRTVTLIGTSVPNGASYLLVRDATATGASVLNVGTGGSVCTLSAGEWAIIAFDSAGTVFRRVAGGKFTAAPPDAQYVTLANDATLTQERVLTPEASVLTLTDAGANSTVTLGVAANGISNAKLRQGVALSVVGVTGNATANVADIAAALDGQVLRRAGTTVAFGAVDLTSANSVSGILPSANLSGAYGNITGVGTLVSGAIPASLVTQGTFGAGNYAFPGQVTFTPDNVDDLGASGANRPRAVFHGSASVMGRTLTSTLTLADGDCLLASGYYRLGTGGSLVLSGDATLQVA